MKRKPREWDGEGGESIVSPVPAIPFPYVTIMKHLKIFSFKAN